MQSDLHVTPRIYSKPFPRFSRPKIIGYIDLDKLKFARKVHDNRVNYDLNIFIEEATRKPQDIDVKLTDLLRFLLENEKRLHSIENKLENARFHCYRGLMTCVACTPYERRDAWKIVVILFKGNIFLCARDTDEKKLSKTNMTNDEQRFTSWGYKFEQYILSDTPDTKPNPNVPVDENEEFSLIFTTNLNQHTILYGAEMDGIRCDKIPIPLPPTSEDPETIIQYLSTKEFIELKTNRHLEHFRQETSFRKFKTKKWWLQSFLVGIDTILCGFRNDDGIVEELKVYNLKDLPKMSQKFWDPNVCFNFLDSFFTYTKRCLERKIIKDFDRAAVNNLQALPLITLLLEWSPGMPVHVSDNYAYEDDPILPHWFIDQWKTRCHST